PRFGLADREALRVAAEVDPDDRFEAEQLDPRLRRGVVEEDEAARENVPLRAERGSRRLVDHLDKERLARAVRPVAEPAHRDEERQAVVAQLEDRAHGEELLLAKRSRA